VARKLISEIDIGIIGGSGVYKIEGFSQVEEVVVSTPFGGPSDTYIIGVLNGIRVAFLPRHGRGHVWLPSELNYRANIFGFKALGVSHIIAITAVGSLREDRPPLDMVIPDQLIDRTHQRQSTFFGQGIVAHIPFAVPFCPRLSQLLYDTAGSVVDSVHKGGTLVTIEGPGFSTKAESRLFRKWGCDIIGMTTFQEAKLSREAEICYAALAMVTDYDCWREGSIDEVNVQTVVANLKKNSSNAQAIITAVLPEISKQRSCLCADSLQGAIMTAPDSISQDTRERLALLIEDRISAKAKKN
jgi:5'-methylthioadenosine phosphorylase